MKFRQISATVLATVKRNECWSISNLDEEEGRKVEYIGSEIKENGYVFDYYRDNTGAYWYDTRWRESSGRIVSMDVHIFGREIKKSRRKTPRP